MKSTAFAFLMILSGSLVNAQTRVVYGSIKLFDTYPVEHVELYSKKAKASAMTDSLGQFNIVCMDKDVIQVKPKVFKAIWKKKDRDFCIYANIQDHVTWSSTRCQRFRK